MQRIIHFWKSGIMGKLVIGCGGLIGLLFICVICGVLFGQEPSRKILELDERLKPFSNKTLNLQNVSEIKLDQTIQVGEYLVKVTSLERTTQYLTYFGKKEALIKAAKGHEFLIFEVEYQKLSREEAEEKIVIFPAIRGDYEGVTFELAHDKGHEVVSTVLEGKCRIDPDANYPVGWKGRGRCVIYYKKEWNPRYLVLSSWAKGIVLAFPMIKDKPIAKIPL